MAKGDIVLITFAIMGFLSCQSSSEQLESRINTSKQHLAYYEKAMKEIKNSFDTTQEVYLTSNQIDSLLRAHKNSFKNLQFLVDNKLIVTKKGRPAILLNKGAFDFWVHESHNSRLAQILSDRKVYHYDVVSFDPKQSWIETESTIGVTDDFGFNELKNLDSRWYYVSRWSLDE